MTDAFRNFLVGDRVCSHFCGSYDVLTFGYELERADAIATDCR